MQPFGRIGLTSCARFVLHPARSGTIAPSNTSTATLRPLDMTSELQLTSNMMAAGKKSVLVYHYGADGKPVVREGLAVITMSELVGILQKSRFPLSFLSRRQNAALSNSVNQTRISSPPPSRSNAGLPNCPSLNRTCGRQSRPRPFPVVPIATSKSVR